MPRRSDFKVSITHVAFIPSDVQSINSFKSLSITEISNLCISRIHCFRRLVKCFDENEEEEDGDVDNVMFDVLSAFRCISTVTLLCSSLLPSNGNLADIATIWCTVDVRHGFES